MHILFDAMGAQVQVQQATGHRLTRWFHSLTRHGHHHGISDVGKPLAPQLEGVDVYVSTTRQYADGHSNLPPGTDFGYSQADLGALQTFVHTTGGSVLMFTNHSYPIGAGPLWPINEIQLAASLGIHLVFAAFGPPEQPPPPAPPMTLVMHPAGHATPELVRGVKTVEAWDSGGIVPRGGTALIALPDAGHCRDHSGLGYPPHECSFAALYRFGAGKVIVAGHSGITANDDTQYPSWGQIGKGENETFLNNCIAYLGSRA